MQLSPDELLAFWRAQSISKRLFYMSLYLPAVSHMQHLERLQGG